MREPPDLPNEAIVAALGASYGLRASSLLFLPIGHDGAAWVYRADADDDAAYFVKLRRGGVNEAGLRVPHALRESGISHVVAPLSSVDQRLWTPLGDYALILYPFLEGRTGMEVGLSEPQWIEFGTVVKQIHAATLPPDLAGMVRREAYAPQWDGVVRHLGAVRELGERIAVGSFGDPIQRELAAYWRARAAQIRAVVDRADDLGRRLRRAALPPVLCHADLHTGNVLLDAEGRLWIVDWDEVVYAPKERDLTFVRGGISRELVGPREEELFFQGYGHTAVDPLALAYYRTTWAVQDIGAYAEQVFAGPEIGAVTRRAAADGFMSLFEPGEIVDIAHMSEGV